MDVIFINAVTFCTEENPHIGQFILRDILKDNYEVECVNFDLLNKRKEIQYVDDFYENIACMGEYILKMKPKVVGFYTICNSAVVAFKTAEYVKKRNPEIHTVFGGPQTSVTVDECLNAFSFIDCICIGESEYSIKLLIDALIEKKELDNVPGVAFRKGNQIIRTEHAQLVNSEELHNYTVFDYTPFKINSDMLFPIEGGRGCPYSCTFCTTSSFWNRTFRIKPVDLLIEEMKFFNKEYGVYKFMIHHDMFTVNRKHVIEFCNRIIEEKLPFEWRCSSRVDVLDEELIDKMKESNCVDIFLGIETGSNRMQKTINKNLNLKNAIKIMKYAVKKGINVTASFMYCFPDETKQDFMDTINMLEKCFYSGIIVELHRYVPTPSTTETKKIIDKMYFDRNAIAISHNNIKFDETFCGLIKQYPNMFSQYYTFDSEIGKTYGRFNLLIDLIIVMDEFFKYSIRAVVEKYGLEKLYFLMEENLDNIYYSIQNERVYARVSVEKRDKYNMIFQMFKEVFENELNSESGQELLFLELFKYEKLKYEYFITKVHTPKVYKFKINMEDALSNMCVNQEDYYVRFSYKNDKVYVQRVIPREKVLC